MTTARRYPDGVGAPVDLFAERDAGLALQVAPAVLDCADQQLNDMGEPGSSGRARGCRQLARMG